MTANSLLSSVNNYRGWWLARYQRVLIPVLISFLLGVLLAAYQYQPQPGHAEQGMPGWCHPLMLLAWGSILLGGMLVTRKRYSLLGLFYCFALLLGGSYYGWQHLNPGLSDVSHWAKGQQVRVVGEWYTAGENPKSAQLVLRTLNHRPVTGLLQIRMNKHSVEAIPTPGSLVSIDGRLSLPEESSIPGAFNERRYLASQRVTAVLHHLTQLETLETEPSNWKGTLFRYLGDIRHQITLTFKAALPSPLSEITGGIVLGDQAIPVERSVRQEFTRTGLVHLLAASGMNVAIVAAFLFALARLCRLPRLLQMIIAMLGILIYALLSGLSPSVLRATAMLEIALILKLADKSLNHISVLLMAVFALVLWNPELVTNVGFQLSVVTTFGIIAMVPPLQQWLGYWLGEKWSGILLLPVVAQLWAAPLLITYFNQLPLLGILLNIIVLPVITIMTGLGFTVALLSLVWQPLGFWLAKLAWPFAAGLYWLVSFTQGWEWAQIHIASFSARMIAIVYGLLLLGAYFLAFPNKWKSLCALIQHNALIAKARLRPKLMIAFGFLFVSCVLFWFQENNKAIYIDVLPLNYRNTAFLLNDDLSGQKTLLLPNTITPWYSRKISDFLRHQNIHRIDHLVWIPSLGRVSNTEVQQAVLDQIETVSAITLVQMLDELDVSVQKNSSFELSKSPLQSLLRSDNPEYQAIIAPEWMLRSRQNFCLSAVLEKSGGASQALNAENSCPLQFWQIANASQPSNRSPLQRWMPDNLPQNRYFEIKRQFDGQWRIID